jgi:phage gpG-like protein
MIKIGLSPRARALLAKTEKLPAAVPQAVARTMDRQNELMVGRINREKLSRRGQMTLGVVTGRLRRSLRPSKASIAGNTVTSAIGTNVEYAAVHEFGFNGEVAVKAHRRKGGMGDRFALGSRSVNRMQALKLGILSERQVGEIARSSTSFGVGSQYSFSKTKAIQVASGYALVHAHTRKMNIPARRMIASGIEENAEKYSAALSRAIVEVLTA